jgi:hypothetical protein
MPHLPCPAYSSVGAAAQVEGRCEWTLHAGGAGRREHRYLLEHEGLLLLEENLELLRAQHLLLEDLLHLLGSDNLRCHHSH